MVFVFKMLLCLTVKTGRSASVCVVIVSMSLS